MKKRASMDFFNLRGVRRPLTILKLIVFLGAGSVLAGAAKGQLPPNVPSADEVASLIGGGNVVAKVTSFGSPRDLQCTYEYARNPDGSRSKNTALLSVVSYSDSNAARAIFDGYITSAINSLLDSRSFGSTRILRLEQGDGYTAFSDGSVARAIHDTTLVTFAVMDLSRTRSRSSDYLHWSDKIRQLAIRAAGATADPGAKISPPPGLPKAIADSMSWNVMDDVVWPVIGLLPFAIGPIILVIVFGSIWLRSRRRRRSFQSSGGDAADQSRSPAKKSI